jgi:hypothetical protein
MPSEQVLSWSCPVIIVTLIIPSLSIRKKKKIYFVLFRLDFVGSYFEKAHANLITKLLRHFYYNDHEQFSLVFKANCMASAYEKIRGNTLEQNDTLIYLLEFQ